MRKLLLSLAMSGVLLCLAVVAQAHPPSDIKLAFNATTKILTVTALHDVKDPAKHYINKVTVAVNGMPMVTQNFMSQTNKVAQISQYTIIDAMPGDAISVNAVCNYRGDLTKVMKVK